MTYTDIYFYTGLYPDDEIEDSFSRMVWDASKLIDRFTTGLDGVKKLHVAYPTKEDDAETVMRCACAIIHAMFQVEQMENAQAQAAQYIKNADGTYQSALVSSRSAGNESISYSGAGDLAKSSSIAAAVADPQAREKLYRDTVTDYLSGVQDANGVNLLYMGRYPRV